MVDANEARINSSLLEMLRQDFELDVRGVDPLPADDSGINVNLVWQRFRRAVRDIARWEVQEDVWLGLFSFAKYLMWKDLVDRTQDLKRSPVVAHLLDHPGDAFPDEGEFPAAESLDDTRHPAGGRSPHHGSTLSGHLDRQFEGRSCPHLCRFARWSCLGSRHIAE